MHMYFDFFIDSNSLSSKDGQKSIQKKEGKEMLRKNTLKFRGNEEKIEKHFKNSIKIK